MRKFLVFLLIATLVAFSTVSICLAEPDEPDGVLTAEILNHNGETRYHVFSDPSDIEYSDNGLYVRCSDGYEVYDGENFALSDIKADSIAALSGGIAALSDGDLSFGTSRREGNYSCISAYKNVLYAAQGKTIQKFDCENGELVLSDSLQAAGDVLMMAATDNGCMYAVYRTGYTYVYLGDEQLTSIDERVLDMTYLDNKYYILTASNIYMYTDFFLAPVACPAMRGAIALSAGDGIYLLCGTGTVVRYTVDLGKNNVLIASSGELDWFYTTPVNIDTKLKNIIVTDKSLGTGTGLGRVALISGEEIEYISELNAPVAATADNRGRMYIAHSGNKVAVYDDGNLIDERTIGDKLVDIEVDYDGNLYCLDRNGDVLNAQGTVLRNGVKAMKFLSTMHYMTDEYIDDNKLTAKDFALDVMGNIFAVSGNKITAIVDGVQREYTVSNASNLTAIAISKVETSLISYGDLIMIDETNMCVLTLKGSSVGSVNAKNLFTPPELDNTPNPQADGLVGETEGAIVFALPVEGDIVYEAKRGENLILLKEGNAPNPYVYCAIDALDESGKQILIKGYVYKSAIRIKEYYEPKYAEAKINANNTPVYKYPSLNSPIITEYSKNTMVAILPFAATYPDKIEEGSLYSDVWYNDAYDVKWYRISYGSDEGYIVATDADVNIFSNEIEMPQPNATINSDATLYRYDEATKSYVEFTSLGKIDKETRVKVDIPYGASENYTKIIFYREGLGVIDADCFVETRFIDFDGVDVVKIIAICVIVLALLILMIVVIRRLKYRRLNRSRSVDSDIRQQ